MQDTYLEHFAIQFEMQNNKQSVNDCFVKINMNIKYKTKKIIYTFYISLTNLSKSCDIKG